MLSWRFPSRTATEAFLTTQRLLPLTYAAEGATAATSPAGYDGYKVDRFRLELGEGEEAFNAAQNALLRWEHFRLGWLEAVAPTPPVESGQVVAVAVRAMGLWWLNACRIVYIVDEASPVRRFGFAYGTLAGHVESGEERFLIEWNPVDNRVSYEILVFFRANHWTTRLGYPLVRRMQHRFRRDSGEAMRRAVGGV